MKKQFSCFILYVITIYFTGSVFNPAIAASQPSGGNGTHFCGVNDSQWSKRHSDQYPNRLYARTFVANLNVGEPRTVRMIYFLPNDRPYRVEVVQKMKDEILDIQAFYAEQMGVHGYGEVSFRIETNVQGKPMVHRVDGEHPDSHYLENPTDSVRAEIEKKFDIYANIYFIVIDNSINGLGWFGGQIRAGVGSRWGKNGGYALTAQEFGLDVVAHELGHAFGLWHDFRDGAYLMSYGPSGNRRLSTCHAEFLSVHPYFNANTSVEKGPPPSIELISLHTYPAESKSVPVRLRISDSDELHQVFLHADQPNNRDTVKACRGLRGENERIVDFDYDGIIPLVRQPSKTIKRSFLSFPVHPIRIEAVDVNGNVNSREFVLLSEALQPLLKISGDNQHGSLPNTPLPVPFVVEVRDLDDGSVRNGVPVTFTVTAGGGTLSKERTETDASGVAESLLTLGPHVGVNTVEVSAAGMTVTFTAEAVAAVEIPDSNLRAVIEATLKKSTGEPIAPVEMAALTRLEAKNANISDLTGLEFAASLTWLSLDSNDISSLSPVAGLTNLIRLSIQFNRISDLSPLASLVNLENLNFWGNSVSDISPVMGLTNLTHLSFGRNNISDISPLASLINLTRLSLVGNNISGLSPLASLVNLEVLQFGGNSVLDISPVAGLTNLIHLSIDYNDISDISVLAGLTQLTRMPLQHNNISDLSPLVANAGVGEGDELDVRHNPLSYQSIHTHIPTLQSRGVTVEFENQPQSALLKIAGDNQHGSLPNTPLPVPFVVEVRDLDDGSARNGVPVTFTVTAGGGTLSRERTETDASGRAESLLTLGAHLGVNTVEVSAAGMTVTFTAITGDPVDIPDANLRAAIENTLSKAQGQPIAAAEMARLTELQAPNANISDLTGLEHAINLRNLNLSRRLVDGNWINSNSVSDLSPLSDLTSLTHLWLEGNAITDISPVAGLVNLVVLHLGINTIADISPVAGLVDLTKLVFWYNNVTDISPLAGLTNLTRLQIAGNNIADISPLVANTGLGAGDEVDVRRNPLSYLSIQTHIPVLQNRAVAIEFDDRAHPALLKISGDNQTGASLVLLAQPFVVEVQDENGSVVEGISVTFAVTAGGGRLNTTLTTTAENGRAESTLTLGPNLGTNTIKVSAAGIDSAATFYAISDADAPPIMADVNSDGSINVLDLIVVTSAFGSAGTNQVSDVNRDGVVDILDLVVVAGMFEEAAAAPSAQPQVPETLTAVEVQGWLTDARALEVRDPIMKRGFLVLEQLLVFLTPKKAELLANYPNPFNPETWIPYRVAEDAFVTLTIYDGIGRAVRTLDVGHRIASAYESRSKAVHWDGKNELGESVASGIYFYTLTTGDYSATRKMLILK